MKKIVLYAGLLGLLNIVSYSCAEPLPAKRRTLIQTHGRAMQENVQPFDDHSNKPQACKNICIAGSLCVAATRLTLCGACVVPVVCYASYLLAERRYKESSEKMERD